MQHLKFDVGYQSAGAVVRVTLEGTEANVRLVDSFNYREYAAGRRHQCVGGHYKSSPAVLTVPHAAHWYVAVDYGAYAGRGRAAVQVIPAAS
ncbi:uncharacterized protein DUF1883 [Mycobacterium sp. BK558]|nr:uncharacterized protein DUF1883 [Mycobacterium sp. BK558]